MNLLFVNLPPTGLHESQTACARLPAAKQKGRLFEAAFVTCSAFFSAMACRRWMQRCRPIRRCQFPDLQ